jgi:hypothetical protein
MDGNCPRSSSGKARTTARLHTWRGFVTQHGGELGMFASAN